MCTIYEKLKILILDLDIENKSKEQKIYQIDRYIFYLAMIGKYTYKIFHNNKDLFKKATEKLINPDSFFSTYNEHENEKRKETYAFFSEFKINEFNLNKKQIFSIENIKRILFVIKNDRYALKEIFKRNNEILHDMLNIRVNQHFIRSKLYFISYIRLKMLLFHPLLFLGKMYVDIGYMSDYEDIFNLLDDERNKIICLNGKKTNAIIESKKKTLFDIYTQFEKDYDFFIEETGELKPYIVETKYHLIWISDDGLLAEYFKSIVPNGCDFKCAVIEKIFLVEDIKRKSRKKNKKWNEFNEKLTVHRTLHEKNSLD
jgi:hypothetical protein